MASRHLANEVAPDVVARMLGAAEGNYSIAHDYYRLKAVFEGVRPGEGLAVAAANSTR